jgi:hypothetical protein
MNGGPWLARMRRFQFASNARRSSPFIVGQSMTLGPMSNHIVLPQSAVIISA